MNWDDVIRYASHGSPSPERRVEKTDSEWRSLLTPDEYRITRMKGTEIAFSGEYCQAHDPGVYACRCCGTTLFDSGRKFDSGTGWPSFTEPVKDNVIKYLKDESHGMTRVEVMCNVCDAHLGHVFPDGPQPSGLRFCINSAAIRKLEKNEIKSPKEDTMNIETITLGGGCFWCVEAVYLNIAGVIKAEPGYSGGHTLNPTYKEVCTGSTGHAEVVRLTYDKDRVDPGDILRVFFETHDPTTLNRQGADVGTQYRSVIFYQDEDQKQLAEKIMAEVQQFLDEPVITALSPLGPFYKAEDYHQNYYYQNQNEGYCRMVIAPKLDKLRKHYARLLK